MPDRIDPADRPPADDDAEVREGLGEYRQRVRARVLAQLPSTEQAAQMLRDLVEGGLPGYTEPLDDDAMPPLPGDLDPEVRARLVAWEAHASHRLHAWAEDRFKLGFALGSGQYARLFTAFDW